MPNIDITIQLMQYIFYRFFVSFQCRNEFQFIEASSSNLLYLQLEHFLSHLPTYFKCLYTGRYRYNVNTFYPKYSQHTPHSSPYGDVWGVFCEYKHWFLSCKSVVLRALKCHIGSRCNGTQLYNEYQRIKIFKSPYTRLPSIWRANVKHSQLSTK